MNSNFVIKSVVILVLVNNVFGIAVSYNGKHSKLKAFEETFKVKRGQFPYVVSVNNECTGTFISKQWILTAAHCISSTTVKIFYGSNRKKDLIETEGVAISHPFYATEADNYIDVKESDEDIEENGEKKTSISNRQRTNKKGNKHKHEASQEGDDGNDEEEVLYDWRFDMALIKIEEPDLEINAVILPKKNSTPPQENEEAVIVGWGEYRIFEEDGVFLHVYHEDESAILRQVHLTLRLPHECLNSYKTDMEGRICAGSSTENTCPGDSGSPLLINGVQWGIDSYGDQNVVKYTHEWNRNKVFVKGDIYCATGPDVFVSTWHHLDWIHCVVGFEKKFGSKFVGLYCANLYS